MKRTCKRVLSSSPPRDEGTTFLGTLVALAMLAVAIATAYPFFRTILGAMSDSIRRTSEVADVRVLDAAVRRAMERVRPPFWSVYATEDIDGGYAFPFFDGIESDRLRIYLQDGALTLEAEGFHWRSNAIRDCKVYTLTGTDGVTRGVGLDFLVRGISVRVEAPFGAYPHGAGSFP